MAKGNLSSLQETAAEKTGNEYQPQVMVNEQNIDELEKETVERVSRTLSALETAIVSWENSKEKPEPLARKFTSYKRLYDALAAWEKKMLMSMGKREKFPARVQRLQEFVNICYTYS